MTKKSDNQGVPNKEIRELRQLLEALLKENQQRDEQFKEILKRQHRFEMELRRLAETASGTGETISTLYDLHASLLGRVDELESEQADIIDKLDPLIVVVDGLIRDKGQA